MRRICEEKGAEKKRVGGGSLMPEWLEEFSWQVGSQNVYISRNYFDQQTWLLEYMNISRYFAKFFELPENDSKRTPNHSEPFVSLG